MAVVVRQATPETAVMAAITTLTDSVKRATVLAAGVAAATARRIRVAVLQLEETAEGSAFLA